MVIVLKHNAKPEEKEIILKFLENKGLKIKEIVGEQETILGIVGTVGIDKREVEVLPGVSNVIPISKPYKLTSREFKREDTIIPIGQVAVEIRTTELEESLEHMLSVIHGKEKRRLVDGNNSKNGERIWCCDPQRRCLQSPDIALCIPGNGRRGTEIA